MCASRWALKTISVMTPVVLMVFIIGLMLYAYFMNANLGIERDFQGLQQDLEVVDSYISAGIREVATELGGDELAESVTPAAVSGTPLPNLGALTILEGLYPGAAERIMTRSAVIQAEAHKRELLAIQKPGLRKYGGAILKGFASFNIWGTQSKRNR